MALVGEPDACLDQAESYTTPSRGIEGKAGRLGVADPSPDNNILLTLMSRPKDVPQSSHVMRFTECDQIETDNRTAKRLLNRLQKAQKNRNQKRKRIWMIAMKLADSYIDPQEGAIAPFTSGLIAIA